MKTKEFIFYLFFLLLVGGHNFYASTSTSNEMPISKFSPEKNIKQIGESSFSAFIENSDFDFEEEFNAQNENKDDVKWHSSNTYYLNKIYYKNSYKFIPCHSITIHYSNFLQYPNTPLYLSQGVLRI